MQVVSRIFFFNDTATTEIYTLSLHDALPISIGLHCQYGPFYDEGADSLRSEAVEYAKQLRGQPQSKKIPRALAIDERLPDFRRDQIFFKTAQRCHEMSCHAMVFREDKQARPIRGTKQARDP